MPQIMPKPVHWVRITRHRRVTLILDLALDRHIVAGRLGMEFLAAKLGKINFNYFLK